MTVGKGGREVPPDLQTLTVSDCACGLTAAAEAIAGVRSFIRSFVRKSLSCARGTDGRKEEPRPERERRGREGERKESELARMYVQGSAVTEFDKLLGRC